MQETQESGETRRAAGNLFLATEKREGAPMLIIAVGLTIALVAADFLEISRAGGERRRSLP
jgi:hypothetical protein